MASPTPTISARTSAPSSTPQYYHYDPSTAAATIFSFLFLATTLLHLFQVFRTKTWYFIPFVLGGVLEIAGYICRTENAHKTPHWDNGLYILEQIGILIAPAFLAASMYMLFGRLIRLTDGDSRSLIRQKILTAIFVTGDVLSLVVQAGGGGILGAAKDPDKISLGQHIIETGIFVQIFAFATFVAVSVIFYRKITQRPTIASVSPTNPWKKHLYILFATSFLIFIRCIFRVIMYIQGEDGSISSSEVLFYIFDSCFIFTVMVSFNIVHPSEVRAMLHGEGRIAWRGRYQGPKLPSQPGPDGFSL